MLVPESILALDRVWILESGVIALFEGLTAGNLDVGGVATGILEFELELTGFFGLTGVWPFLIGDGFGILDWNDL